MDIKKNCLLSVVKDEQILTLSTFLKVNISLIKNIQSKIYNETNMKIYFNIQTS